MCSQQKQNSATANQANTPNQRDVDDCRSGYGYQYNSLPCLRCQQGHYYLRWHKNIGSTSFILEAVLKTVIKFLVFLALPVLTSKPSAVLNSIKHKIIMRKYVLPALSLKSISLYFFLNEHGLQNGCHFNEYKNVISNP